MLRKRSYNFPSFCENTLWTIINCSLRLIIFDNTRKISQLVFSLERLPFFFKNLRFQQPLRCKGNDLITSTVIVRIPCGPFRNVPWGLSCSKIPGKMSQKLLSTWKLLFFEMFVSIDLLGLKKWFYHLHNTCQNTLCALTLCSPRFVKLDNTRTSRPKSFFTGELAFFGNICF